MQYLSAISKTTEWSLFVSKANHSRSQQTKSMPQLLMLKKLKLNGSMKTYKTFWNKHKKRCPFLHRRLECRSRKSKDTWKNRQDRPWSKEWSRAKAKRILPKECTGHSKHPLPITQEIVDVMIYTWTSPDCQYQNQTDYILCSGRWRSSI